MKMKVGDKGTLRNFRVGLTDLGLDGIHVVIEHANYMTKVYGEDHALAKDKRGRRYVVTSKTFKPSK